MLKTPRNTAVALATLAIASFTVFAGNGGGSHGSGGGGGGGGNSNHGNSGSSSMESKGTSAHESKSDKAAKEIRQPKTAAEHLNDNKKLSSKLSGLLPAGTDIQAASAGFKNLGQFVAALHVSKNLGIPFTDLKAKLLEGISLGAAIKQLKPSADAERESKKAEDQAEKDIK